MSKKILKYLTTRIFAIAILQLLTLNFYVTNFGINLYSKEVTFTDGDRKVILLGVSHVGESEYFQSINNRYGHNYRILLEGINGVPTDEAISHDSTALIFGLDYQKKDFLKTNKHNNVDIHADELDEKISQTVSSSLSFWKHLAVFNFKEAKESFSEVKDVSLTELYDEVILKRNEKIKMEILTSTDDVVIPWGAIHQNDMESFLLNNGYKKESTSFIKIASIPKILYNTGKHFILGLYAN